jgi:hypothetical protein
MKYIYVYYRVDPEQIESAGRCSQMLLTALDSLGVKNTALLQRVEQDSPYITLMETFQVPDHIQWEIFQAQMDELVSMFFEAWPQPPQRKLEVFQAVSGELAA